MSPNMNPIIQSMRLVRICLTVLLVSSSGRCAQPAAGGSLDVPQFQEAKAVDLLKPGFRAGEIVGWRSFHETPGTKTIDVWQFDLDGVLICRGTPKGYLYTEKNYQDFIIRFEWRYPAGSSQGKGGVLVRMTGEDLIWPKCLELQLNQGQAGDFWAIRGFEVTGPVDRVKLITNSPYGTLRHLPRTSGAEKKAGEWNLQEAVVRGDTVIQYLNGLEVNRASGCEVQPGKILLTAEGPEIQFRNLRLMPLPQGSYNGRFYSGEGDTRFLELLDLSRRMFEPDAEFQNLPMLYTPAWNGFVEGPTWGAWWIQNSYGTTYCGLPFYQEPMATFLQNAQDLWFDQMGDGKRTFKWQNTEQVIPDGQLCDAASPGWYMPKQGDGNVGIHDWGVEFTAAGLLMQAETLLINRDPATIQRYLGKLRRCADFLESRRDPANNLFLAGPAGNLLAPSYAGWKKPDGTYHPAYLAGLSITYIAGLDRMVELEKLAGHPDQAAVFAKRRDLARQGLPKLTTDEGYFIKYLDPDGTRHGVYGADKHGYFEAVCNHDAICFRVVDDAQAEKIYQKMASIPGLRPHDIIITNCRGLDDMYTPPTDWLWKFGTWVNGGHWSTCEARMIMAYYRLGHFEDARRAMEQILKFARAFRMDNPLVDFGGAVYQPGEPVNLCYDTFGPPFAMVRGLFEYLYQAESLVLKPHIPTGISKLEQHFPVRFGSKQVYLAAAGSGPITAVTMNGQAWNDFGQNSINLPFAQTPATAVVSIGMGGNPPPSFTPRIPDASQPPAVELAKIPFLESLFPILSPNELPVRIGADSDGGSRFQGQIARARIYNRALTASEVVESSTAVRPASSQGLVADWRLDSKDGKFFENQAGQGLSARATGQVGLTNTLHGPAVVLVGNGFLEVANDPRFNLTNSCTLEAWICPQTQAPTGGRIIDKSKVGSSNGYLLDTYPGNSLRFITELGVLSYDARLKPGVWAHVAATINQDGALALYLNGQQVAALQKEKTSNLASLDQRVAKIRQFRARLAEAGLTASYEAAHARLALEYAKVTERRFRLVDGGGLAKLPARSQVAADKSYLSTLSKLCEGLEKTLDSYREAKDPQRQQVWKLWHAQ